ncbi:MAG: amidohydrolase [Promethearchaeota archaeon]|nr:MAG: amidohydrolase [Candidatus Lokiarchaeota archaeon]
MTISIKEWIEERAEIFTGLSDAIWGFAETKFRETQSAQILQDKLEEHGFRLQKEVGDIPTAFIGEWGSGSPIIAIMGEFDALPSLSQKPQPTKEPVVKGGAGHGCGHNLLGVGSLAACLVLKEIMIEQNLPGTIRYYGTPAEEGGAGKVFMINEGAFEGIDICMTWHPEDLNMIHVQNWQALIGVKFKFYGTAAHAATDPYNGRSALDAVELMNIATNYLREHVKPGILQHYVITNGGGAPNVVPEYAESYHYIRASHIKDVLPVFERYKKIAEGACLMTGTTFEYEVTHGGSNYLSNQVIEEVLYEQMNDVGPPAFDEKDIEIGKGYRATLPPDFFEGLVAKVPEQYRKLADHFRPMVVAQAVLPIFGREVVIAGSSDVGDVSWNVPTAQFSSACYVIGTSGHSWQRTAQAATSIGHKGMLNAAKILAQSGLKFLKTPGLVQKAKDEFAEKIAKTPYQPPFPPGTKPPFPEE